MKVFSWDPEKNLLLQETRGISFEAVVLNIELGNEVDIFEHPNQSKYPRQRISVVVIEDYAYLVPFIESDEEIFLKTIIPSRKATKQYVGESNGKVE
ncbi:MAG: toxin [Proteobacteria bacterium]|nr:toxin [Pseudomonadota bacterium]